MRGLTIICFLMWLSGCVYHDFPVSDETPSFLCNPSTISWRDDILPVMQASCAKFGCHDGIARLDWTDYQQVKSYAAAIKSKTQDRSMPFDGTLPEDDIARIACWVEAGAPDN